MSEIISTIVTFGLPTSYVSELESLCKQVTSVKIEVKNKGVAIGNAILNHVLTKEFNLLYVFVDSSLRGKLSGVILDNRKLIFIGSLSDIKNAMEVYLDNAASTIVHTPISEQITGEYNLMVLPKEEHRELHTKFDTGVNLELLSGVVPETLPQAQKLIIDLRIELDKLVTEKQDNLVKFSKIKDLIAKMESHNEELAKRKDELEVQLGLSNSKLIELQNKLDDLVKASAADKQLLSSMTATLNTNAEKLLGFGGLENEVRELEHQLELEKETNNKLISELEHASDKIEDLSFQVSEANAKLEDCRQRYESDLAELTQKLEDLGVNEAGNTDELRAELDRLKGLLSLKESKIIGLTKRLDEAQNLGTKGSAPLSSERILLNLPNVTFVARADNLDISLYTEFIRQELGKAYYVVDMDYNSQLFKFVSSAFTMSYKNINKWLQGKYTYSDLCTPIQSSVVSWKGILTTFMALPTVPNLRSFDLVKAFKEDVLLSKEDVLVNLGSLTDVSVRELFNRYKFNNKVLVFVGGSTLSSKIALQLSKELQASGVELDMRFVGVEGVPYIKGLNIGKLVKVGGKGNE